VHPVVLIRNNVFLSEKLTLQLVIIPNFEDHLIDNKFFICSTVYYNTHIDNTKVILYDEIE